jgi:putative hydrolase of the HAD superfamily
VKHDGIEALFVDIGGVLLTNGWDQEMRREAARRFELDYEDMNERHHLTFDTYEEGKLSLDSYLDRTVFHRKRAFTREEFKVFMYAQSRPLPEMIDLVRGLKRRHGLKVAAISNEGRELTLHRVGTFGLGEFIDFFVSSCFVHMRKPDADMYRMALDCAQVAPETAIYVDDRPLFVEVARSLDLGGVVHVDAETTRLELAALGLET